MTEDNYMQIFEYVAANLLLQPCGLKALRCLVGRDYGWWVAVVSPHHKAVGFELYSLGFGMCFALVVPGKHLSFAGLSLSVGYMKRNVYTCVFQCAPLADHPPLASSDIPEPHFWSPPLYQMYPLIRKIYTPTVYGIKVSNLSVSTFFFRTLDGHHSPNPTILPLTHGAGSLLWVGSSEIAYLGNHLRQLFHP